MMKWVLIAVGSLIALGVVAVAVGALLPQGHVASRTARFKQSPDVLWQTIADIAASPSWRPDVKSVERLPDSNGHEMWREVGKYGQPMPMETIESIAPRRLVRRIADPKLPFGGTWTFEIAPANGGSTVTITENGKIYNPFFRFMARFVLGYTATMETYLKALGKKFGEDAEFVE